MGNLVRELKGDYIIEVLECAYKALAKVYLDRRAVGIPDESQAVQDLDEAVRETEKPVDLSSAIAECNEARKDSHLIEATEQRPAEVFNQLCHMSVILIAATRLASLSPKAPRRNKLSNFIGLV
jgi:hypothetical protein